MADPRCYSEGEAQAIIVKPPANKNPCTREKENGGLAPGAALRSPYYRFGSETDQGSVRQESLNAHSCRFLKSRRGRATIQRMIPGQGPLPDQGWCPATAWPAPVDPQEWSVMPWSVLRCCLCLIEVRTDFAHGIPLAHILVLDVLQGALQPTPKIRRLDCREPVYNFTEISHYSRKNQSC